VKDKRNLWLKTDWNKRKLIIWDQLEDFEIEWTTKDDLKIGFLNSDLRKPNPKKSPKPAGQFE